MFNLAYIPGVWDLLHVGHVAILRRAWSISDRLVVGVASDAVVKEDKGSLPLVCLEHRLQMLSALRYVDVALPYYRFEFLTHLDMLKPNILVVGEQWGKKKRHLDAENWCREYGCRLVCFPYTPDISTTILKEQM